MTEREFCAIWIQTLWLTMSRSGKGYRRQSKLEQRFAGERRKDKIGTTKLQRRLLLNQAFAR